MPFQLLNVVGYTTTQTMQPGMWYIIGSNFENVGGGSVKIREFLKNADLTAGNEVADSATIQMRVAGSPVDYFYNMWNWDETVGPEGDFVPAWCDAGGNLTDDTLPAGTGFWFKEPNNEITYTFAGQVVSEVAPKKTISDMWSLVANPFPTALDLNANMDSTGLVAGNEVADSATVQVRVDGSPVDYFYNMWNWDETVGPEGDFVPAWCDAGGNLLTDADRIAPGVGFWMKNPDATPVEITFYLEKPTK